MLVSPKAQTPIVYHFVKLASRRSARMYTRTKVPAGVSAIQEATSSVKPNPVAKVPDVQEPME